MSGKSAVFENGTVFGDGVPGFLAATPTPYDCWLTGRTPKSPRATHVRQDALPGPVSERVELLPPGGDHGPRIGHDRPGAQGDQEATFIVDARGQRTAYPLARLMDRGALLHDVGDDQLGRVGRG